MPQPPAYERIREDIAAQIATGVFAISSRLPSETELAQRYGVTRMTVRNAVARLVDDGLVVRRQGSGTFVVHEEPIHRSHNRLMSFAREMATQGHRVSTHVLSSTVEPRVPAHVAEMLLLPGKESTIMVRRVRYVSDRPVALQESWIPYGRCPALVRTELVNGSLYETLQSVFGVAIHHAEERISAVAANAEEARLLKTRRGGPLLQIERCTFDEQNQPVEFARSANRQEYWLAARLDS